MARLVTRTNMEVITGQSKICKVATGIQHEKYNVHSYYEDARKQQGQLSPASRSMVCNIFRVDFASFLLPFPSVFLICPFPGHNACVSSAAHQN